MHTDVGLSESVRIPAMQYVSPLLTKVKPLIIRAGKNSFEKEFVPRLEKQKNSNLIIFFCPSRFFTRISLSRLHKRRAHRSVSIVLGAAGSFVMRRPSCPFQHCLIAFRLFCSGGTISQSQCHSSSSFYEYTVARQRNGEHPSKLRKRAALFSVIHYYHVQYARVGEINKKKKLLVPYTCSCMYGLIIRRYYVKTPSAPIKSTVGENVHFSVARFSSFFSQPRGNQRRLRDKGFTLHQREPFPNHGGFVRRKA